MPDRRILIFDLDGTLVDSMGPAADLFCEMLRAGFGIADSVSRPIFTAHMGRGPLTQTTEVQRQTKAFDESLLDQMTADYWAIYENYDATLFSEVKDVVRALHSQGHILLISSGSKNALVQRAARSTGIAPFFSLILGSDEEVHGMAKGSGHFQRFREALGIDESEMTRRGVFVGDGAYDMQVACEAGLVAVGRITDGNGETLRAAGAHFLIDDLREMQDLLGAL